MLLLKEQVKQIVRGQMKNISEYFRNNEETNNSISMKKKERQVSYVMKSWGIVRPHGSLIGPITRLHIYIQYTQRASRGSRTLPGKERQSAEAGEREPEKEVGQGGADLYVYNR